jgi:MFS family permease
MVSDRATVAARLRAASSTAFFLLFSALVVSLFGDHLHRVALTWTLANDLGGVTAGVALGIAMSLPVALFGVFSGVLVDRSDKTTLLIGMDLIRVVIVALITAAFLGAAPSVPFILGLALLLATAGVPFTPTVQSLLPEVAAGDRDRLVNMDAWILGAMSVLSVVGPATAGALLAAVDVAWLFGVDALSFAVSAVLIVRLRQSLQLHAEPLPSSPSRRERPHLLTEARNGLGFLMHHPVLRPQYAAFPFMDSALYAIPFILPAFISTRLHAGAASYGMLLAATAVGRVLGMAVVARTGLKRRRGVVFQANFLLQGVALLTVVLTSTTWVAVLGFLCMGLPNGAAQVAMSSYIQMEVPRELRGRVFAALTSLVTWLYPVGPIVFGAVAAWQDARFALTTIAVTFILGGAYIAAHRPVRAAA